MEEANSLEMPKDEKNQVEEAEMIKMVLPIHINDTKILLEEDLIEKIKLIREHIERDLAKDLRGLEVIHSYKTLPFRKATSKIMKKIKHGEFRVSSMIDEQGYKFKLLDALMLHFKFYPPNKLEDEFS